MDRLHQRSARRQYVRLMRKRYRPYFESVSDAFGPRLAELLHADQCILVGDVLSNYDAKSILRIPGIGKTALSKMQDALAERGLAFGPLNFWWDEEILPNGMPWPPTEPELLAEWQGLHDAHLRKLDENNPSPIWSDRIYANWRAGS